MSKGILRASVVYRAAALVVFLFVTACTKEVDYFPLAAGHVWQYKIARTTMDGTEAQKYVLESRAAVDLNGKPMGRQRTLDGREYYYETLAGGGIQLSAYKLPGHRDPEVASHPRIVLPQVLATGTSWQRQTHTQVLENSGPPWETLFRINVPVEMDYIVASDRESIRVPAGTFHNCVKIVGTGNTNADVGNYVGHAVISVQVVEWYAPQVGLVQLRRTETTDAQALNRGVIEMKLETHYKSRAHF